MRQIVIIGGGHAAAQLCGSLAESAQELAITLISEEAHLPYHRPPLSKAFIKDSAAEPALLRPANAYADAGVQLLLGETTVSIDRDRQTVTLASGTVLAYDELVLATGMRARRLPDLEPAPANLHYVRTVADAQRLRDALAAAASVTVLGGGFIGLEVAATAAALGKQVAVFESQSRLLARSVSPEISDLVSANLREAGISLHLGVSVEEVEVAGGRCARCVQAGSRIPSSCWLQASAPFPKPVWLNRRGWR
ncbi:putidaredoxin reductase [Bordetella holmesii 70147]|nr:putidaredoxin reductase [Bordetella holmesii 70147]